MGGGGIATTIWYLTTQFCFAASAPKIVLIVGVNDYKLLSALGHEADLCVMTTNHCKPNALSQPNEKIKSSCKFNQKNKK